MEATTGCLLRACYCTKPEAAVDHVHCRVLPRFSLLQCTAYGALEVLLLQSADVDLQDRRVRVHNSICH